MKITLAILSVMLLFCVGGCSKEAPARERPWKMDHLPNDPRGFVPNYRIAHYLELAVWLQTLPIEERKDRLREMGHDPDFAPALFPLCRMLFEPARGGEFRRPQIGAPMFVGTTSYDQWPLEPITIFQETPILIVRGYQLRGEVEKPEEYLEYCLKTCRFREFRYSIQSKSRLREVVSKFIESNPAFSSDAEWLRGQAE